MENPSIPPPDGIGEFIAQSRQNASSLKEFRGEFSQAIESLRKSVESLADRLHVATRPNLTLYISVASLAVVVTISFVSLCGYFFNREQTQIRDKIASVELSNREDYKSLDEKLQREFQLMVNNAEQKYQEADKNSKERNENVKRDLDALRTWQNSSDDADRSELRARRLKDVGVQYQPQTSGTKPPNHVAIP